MRLSALRLPILALLCLTLPSCLPVPLGDPEKSAVEAKYLGAWTWADGGQTQVVIFRPWDTRTYLVDALTYTGDPSGPVPKARLTFKGWVTTVGGRPYVTLQPIETLTGAPATDRRKYLVALLSLQGDQLTATGLDPQYAKFKDVGTPTQLEKVVAENFDDVKMWNKAMTGTKLNDGGPPDLEKLLKGFETR